VQNYAKIAKPLTKYLEGQNGKVSMSRKTSLQLDDSAVRAFNELKVSLIAQIELVQPGYNKKIHFNDRCIRSSYWCCSFSGRKTNNLYFKNSN